MKSTEVIATEAEVKQFEQQLADALDLEESEIRIYYPIPEPSCSKK